MNANSLVIGIFDIIDRRKIEFLQKAALDCVKIKVGILSDGFVQQLFGKSTVIDEKSRMAIIQSLKMVDEVILINNMWDFDKLKQLSVSQFLYDDLENCSLFSEDLFHSFRDIELPCNCMCSQRPSNGIIGYTTGVFDLFHMGHLNLLRNAKKNCDFLIVGVSTDELVVNYKKKHPKMHCAERKYILENIEYVDQVVVQKTMDKFDAWKELNYDVLFHGDDWKNSDLYQKIENKLKSVGVTITYFPYTNGISSTILSQKVI